MLAQETLLQLQKYNFDLLARQEPSGRRRMRYIALAHIKDGKSSTETAQALRVTPRVVTKWLKWFIDEGVNRLEGTPHYWSTQRLPKAQEEAFDRPSKCCSVAVVAAAPAAKISGSCWPSNLAWNTRLTASTSCSNGSTWPGWRPVGSVSSNANPFRQAEFKKPYQCRSWPRLDGTPRRSCRSSQT
jgi:hypothetical protein